VPHYKGTIGTAANFVRHVAELAKKESRSRTANFAAD